MKNTLLILSCLISNVYALTIAEIQAIAEKHPSNDEVLKELVMFGGAQEYEIEVKMDFPKGSLDLAAKRVARKIVEGRYVVTEYSLTQPEGREIKMTEIIMYDEVESNYNKWILNSESDILQKMKGVRIKGTQIISWVNIDQKSSEGSLIMIVENYSKDSFTWREVHLKGGKSIFSYNGKAVAIKK
ncbi:MAG: hypothetical protein ACSHX6_06765 [Akkermansiaceae bacterium]